MSAELSSALVTILTAVLSVLAYYARAWMAANIQDKDDRALMDSLMNAGLLGVKATAQAITSAKRDAQGQLPAEVAAQAKLTALEMAKALLGSEKLKAAEVKYGCEGLNKVLSVQIEAALHDVKGTKITTSTSTSAASVSTEGEVTTSTQTKTTTATEPQP